jgi:hypothetical protein
LGPFQSAQSLQGAQVEQLFKGAKATKVFGLKNPRQFSNQAKSEQNPKKGITFFWQTDGKNW